MRLPRGQQADPGNELNRDPGGPAAVRPRGIARAVTLPAELFGPSDGGDGATLSRRPAGSWSTSESRA
jgi:hypothetical protein